MLRRYIHFKIVDGHTVNKIYCDRLIVTAQETIPNQGLSCFIQQYRFCSVLHARIPASEPLPEGHCQLICAEGQDKERRSRLCFTPLGGQGWGRDLPPNLESVVHLLAVVWRGEPMATGTEVLGNGAVS